MQFIAKRKLIHFLWSSKLLHQTNTITIHVAAYDSTFSTIQSIPSNNPYPVFPDTSNIDQT